MKSVDNLYYMYFAILYITLPTGLDHLNIFLI